MANNWMPSNPTFMLNQPLPPWMQIVDLSGDYPDSSPSYSVSVFVLERGRFRSKAHCINVDLAHCKVHVEFILFNHFCSKFPHYRENNSQLAIDRAHFKAAIDIILNPLEYGRVAFPIPANHHQLINMIRSCGFFEEEHYEYIPLHILVDIAQELHIVSNQNPFLPQKFLGSQLVLENLKKHDHTYLKKLSTYLATKAHGRLDRIYPGAGAGDEN